MTDIYNSLLLMLIGMGSVFVFLGIMIICVQKSAAICARHKHLLPEKQPPRRKREKPAAAVPAAAPGHDAGVLTAVISAAVHAYRDQNS